MTSLTEQMKPEKRISLSVFGIQSVLFVFFKPEAFNNLKSGTSPCVSPFQRRCFRFLWVYRQIYYRFLTNQGVRIVFKLLWNSFTAYQFQTTAH